MGRYPFGAPPTHIIMIDLQHGLLMFVIGCTITITGFYIAFLVINYNKRKELEKLKKQKEIKVHPYGDDTV